jgi:RNA polymerase sigma-70 factor
MHPFLVCQSTRRVEQAYCAGRALHGDLGLAAARYTCRINEVLEKYMGSARSEDQSIKFLERLHVADLYLSTACALPTDAAWRRFHQLYGNTMLQAAAYVSTTPDAAKDLADNLPAYLFLPDKARRSRIASFDGRSSLASWLNVIIGHQAINERAYKCNTFERLEDLPDFADHSAVSRVELQMRAHRYELCIDESLMQANQELTERERIILVLHYRDGLEGAEIGRLLGIHSSTVSRALRGAYVKLRDRTLSALASRHQLSDAGVQECLADIRENPRHTILSLLTGSD